MKFPEISLVVDHLHEPALEFAHGERSPHPKDGLFLYGPHSRGKKTREIRVGVIGTSDGIAHFRNWARGIMQTVAVPPPGKGEKKDRLHLANFPGIEETFGISFDPDEISSLGILGALLVVALAAVAAFGGGDDDPVSP